MPLCCISGRKSDAAWIGDRLFTPGCIASPKVMFQCHDKVYFGAFVLVIIIPATVSFQITQPLNL